MFRGSHIVYRPGILNRYRTEAIIALLLFLGFLPMTGLLMGLKNDALKVSYPVYRYMSEALQAGNIPWWHYNLQLGFPLHADPGSLFWNPLLWLFAFLGSSLQVYTYFIWLHVLVGAIGFYQLMRFFSLDAFSGVCFALVFVFSGYYVAHIQHPNYLIEAAWVPWVLLFVLRIFHLPRWRYTAGLAVTLFFLVNSGYPAFPVGMAYFILFLLAALIIRHKSHAQPLKLLHVVLHYLAAVSLSVLMCLPYLISLAEVLPYYYRAENSAIAETFMYQGGMNGSSLVALLFPMATGVEGSFWGTDISWINIYTGSLVFMMSVSLLFSRRWADLWPYYLTGIFFFLISWQGEMKTYIFSRLPLLGYFRNNGAFRIFFILSQLILVAQFCQGISDSALQRLQRIFIRVLLVLYLFAGAAALYQMIHLQGAELFRQWLDAWRRSHVISKELLLLINCSVMALFWAVYRLVPFSRKNGMQVIALDVYLNFLLCLPFTGLGIYSTAAAAKAIEQWRSRESLQNELPGEWAKITGNHIPSKYVAHPALYLHRAAIHDLYGYPSVFSNVVLLWGAHGEKLPLAVKPVQWKHSDGASGKVVRSEYSPVSMAFQFSEHVADTLLVAQNHYPHWKVDAGAGIATVKPLKTPEGLMAVPVAGGLQSIQLGYDPVPVKNCFWFSMTAWVICGFIFAFSYRKRSLADSISSEEKHSA